MYVSCMVPLLLMTHDYLSYNRDIKHGDANNFINLQHRYIYKKANQLHQPLLRFLLLRFCSSNFICCRCFCSKCFSFFCFNSNSFRFSFFPFCSSGVATSFSKYCPFNCSFTAPFKNWGRVSSLPLFWAPGICGRFSSLYPALSSESRFCLPFLSLFWSELSPALRQIAFSSEIHKKTSEQSRKWIKLLQLSSEPHLPDVSSHTLQATDWPMSS